MLALHVNNSLVHHIGLLRRDSLLMPRRSRPMQLSCDSLVLIAACTCLCTQASMDTYKHMQRVVISYMRESLTSNNNVSWITIYIIQSTIVCWRYTNILSVVHWTINQYVSSNTTMTWWYSISKVIKYIVNSP